ncbi:hypothetical protein RCF34_13555 [Pseudomonas sp. 102515]|nr:hypothetical protein [Pseudomonas sp. 102515]MDQ7914133.1 hypothetical protein [Pseudomonas sp. 102515]
MLKDLKRRALRGLLDKLIDQPAERRPLDAQSERSRSMTAHAAH